MRMTLTIDPDVAAMIQKLKSSHDRSLKQVVNEGLRKGLPTLEEPQERKEPFRTKTFDIGECLLPNLDNISRVLDQIEGPNWK